MSRTDTIERPPLAEPFNQSGMGDLTGFGGTGGAMMPMAPSTGGATDQAAAQIIMAQRAAVKRDVPGIMRDARIMAQAAGDRFFYRIPFKDRRSGQTTYVEGPTIQCAMAAVSLYGNCRIEAFPAQETASHWTFMARFVDYEKGVTVVRSFQQRKGQDTGMRDGGRQNDIVFQIGQSKAMRNAVYAALGWLLDEMEAEAKNGLLVKIEKNVDGARRTIAKAADTLEIAIGRIERVVGKKLAEMTVPDLAKTLAQLSSIRDGFATADELFPTAQQAAEELAEAEEAPSNRAPARPAEPAQQEAPPPRRTRQAQPAQQQEAPPPPPPPPAEDEPPHDDIPPADEEPPAARQSSQNTGQNSGEFDGLNFG